jgi:pyruvate ferredoxin oxidoreductase delta subunit
MATSACTDITASSTPSRGEAGRTGDWRVSYPVIDNTKCTPAKTGKPSCFACWAYCPDAVISKTVPLTIDLEYCKGCGICARQCPTNAITMVSEEEHE